MKFQHKQSAKGNWRRLTFFQHMANVGSEVERALLWLEKGNNEYSQKAFERALELLDLTICFNDKRTRFKELTRLRETMVDYFLGDNYFHSTIKLWRKYFFAFNWAARINK